MSRNIRLSKEVINTVLTMISVGYEDDEEIFIDDFWSSYELYLENNYKRFEEKEKQEIKSYSIHCGVGIFCYHIEHDKIKEKEK